MKVELIYVKNYRSSKPIHRLQQKRRKNKVQVCFLDARFRLLAGTLNKFKCKINCSEHMKLHHGRRI